MNILPAIDLRGGKCVRLFQGDYNQETVYADNPVDVAKMWQDQGAKYLHIVDLDGAKEGRLVHGQVIAEIAQAVDMKIEVGGGIRSAQTIVELLDQGVSYAILGTRALEPEFAQEMIERFGSAVVFGVDARDGRVATQGWLETSDVLASDLLKRLDQWGAQRVVLTDIATDGAFTGPNLKAVREALMATSQITVTVSGGVSQLADVQAIYDERNERIFGVIIGKALYDCRLSLVDALAIGA